MNKEHPTDEGKEKTWKLDIPCWILDIQIRIIKIRERFTPEIAKKLAKASQASTHGGSDYLLGWHVIDCLRNGLPMPQDVYDAASWSCIMPLSEKSVLNRSSAMDIPDFTNGA